MRLRILVAVSLAAGCTASPGERDDAAAPGGQPRADTPSAPPAGETPASGSGDRAADSLQLVRLEREARALAQADGCTAGDQCATAPVGDHPCGGPRTFIVYCAARTDREALHRKLSELADAERAFNRRYEIVSTCELRMAPDTELVGTRCQARGQ